MTLALGRDQQTLSGDSLTSGGRPARAFRRGRVCQDPDCETRLSIYNPGSCCCLHEPMARLRTRGLPA